MAALEAHVVTGLCPVPPSEARRCREYRNLSSEIVFLGGVLRPETCAYSVRLNSGTAAASVTAANIDR
jgi:hypothetical protein